MKEVTQPRSRKSSNAAGKAAGRGANELDPVVGQWYLHRDKGESFRVVAVDSAAGLIETQDFDGDLEELDTEAWRALEIELAEPPEDWTGPFDDIESDDLGYTETAMEPRDWRVPLESLRTSEDTRATDEEEGEEERPPEGYTEEQDRKPGGPRAR